MPITLPGGIRRLLGLDATALVEDDEPKRAATVASGLLTLAERTGDEEAIERFQGIFDEVAGTPGQTGALIRKQLFGQSARDLGGDVFAQDIQRGDTAANRRRARANRTILTGSRGLLTAASTERKTLLGA